MNRVYLRWKTVDKMNKILLKYDFQKRNIVQDDLKCTICSNILINASQTRCGCRYCNQCLIDHIENGNIFCAGNGDLCKRYVLSGDTDISIDHRTNFEVSKLVMKCPINSCNHECELIMMEDHLRLCDRKKEKCPFKKFGCQHKDSIKKSLSEHHDELLVDIIGNMKNEIVRLNDLYETNKSEIQALRECLKSYSENYDLINLEIKTIKGLIEDIGRDIDIKIDKKINEISLNTVDINQSSGSSSACQSPSGQVTSPSNQCGMIVWNITRLSEKRRKDKWIKSEYFHVDRHRYKLRLTLWANGYREFTGRGFSIFLLVYPGHNDGNLIWPLVAMVDVRIYNIHVPDIIRKMTKRIVLEKPKYNSFHCSEPFNFDNDDLTECDLYHGDGFSIDCFVFVQPSFD